MKYVWTPDPVGTLTIAWNIIIEEIMTVNLGHMSVNLSLLIQAAHS